MNAQSSSHQSAVGRSRCIIEAILEDIGATYTQVGGGGISAIKQDATNTYTVSISQEERVDQITYEVEIGSDGKVAIVSRKEGTKSMGE